MSYKSHSFSPTQFITYITFYIYMLRHYSSTVSLCLFRFYFEKRRFSSDGFFCDARLPLLSLHNVVFTYRRKNGKNL